MAVALHLLVATRLALEPQEDSCPSRYDSTNTLTGSSRGYNNTSLCLFFCSGLNMSNEYKVFDIPVYSMIDRCFSATHKAQTPFPGPFPFAAFLVDILLLLIIIGDFHMVALSRKREVFSWGYGAEGQGGHGSLLHMRTPRRVNSLQDVPIAQV